MIVHRCFAWNRRAAPHAAGGALWIPREHQGDGRHDNPDLYGCLYLTDRDVSGVVEQLAPWRGHRFTPELLVRHGLPLAVAEIEVRDDEEIVDLDEPRTLTRERLRPSRVATRNRTVTQPQARELFTRHPQAAGLRWWSTFESLWANYTLFDGVQARLDVGVVRRLDAGDELVGAATDLLGIA